MPTPSPRSPKPQPSQSTIPVHLARSPWITPDQSSRPSQEIAERVAARHLHELPVTVAARV